MAASQSPKLFVGVRVPGGMPNIVVDKRKNKMYNVICEEDETTFNDLDSAMAHAKTLNKFVTIKGNGMEVVGVFGVDSVQDGKCPDGVTYDWNKASRIGAVKRR